MSKTFLFLVTACALQAILVPATITGLVGDAFVRVPRRSGSPSTMGWGRWTGRLLYRCSSDREADGGCHYRHFEWGCSLKLRVPSVTTGSRTKHMTRPAAEPSLPLSLLYPGVPLLSCPGTVFLGPRFLIHALQFSFEQLIVCQNVQRDE